MRHADLATPKKLADEGPSICEREDLVHVEYLGDPGGA
jgi:hypothetical protein